MTKGLSRTFWATAGLLVYAQAGYLLLLEALGRAGGPPRPHPSPAADAPPRVSGGARARPPPRVTCRASR